MLLHVSSSTVLIIRRSKLYYTESGIILVINQLNAQILVLQ